MPSRTRRICGRSVRWLRYLRVRTRLGLMALLILAPALALFSISFSEMRAEQRLLGELTTQLEDDVWPLAKLEFEIEQLRAEINRRTPGRAQHTSSTISEVDNRFRELTSRPLTPVWLERQIRTASGVWKKVVPTLRAMEPSPIPEVNAPDQAVRDALVDKLGHMVLVLEEASTRLKQSIIARLAESERAERLKERWLMIGWAVAAPFIALTLYLLALSIIAPLKQLEHASREIAAGSTGARIRIVGTDEFAEVAAAFNAMANTIGDAHERLSDAAFRDPLTTLWNRRHATDVLEDACRRREAFGLMMVDVDHFKAINDQHGHNVGDAVLRWVADRMREVCRETDTVIRYAGDEFLIVLPGLDEGETGRIAGRLSDRVQRCDDGCKVPVSLSVGYVAKGLETCVTAEKLLHMADQALYIAKNAGRGRAQRASTIAT